MMLTRFTVGAALTVILTVVAPVDAQSPRPASAVEGLAGYAGFIDDAMIHHAVIGGAARIYVSPRLSVGPEVTYMIGPDQDRDLFFLGNLTFDILRPRNGRPPRASPFLIIGGGGFMHSDRVGTGTFRSWEGAFAGGGGVRVSITERVFGMADFRCGWEPHYRVTGGVGVTL